MSARDTKLLRGLIVAILALGPAAPAFAQQTGSGLTDPQRDCQTIRNCQYAKGGAFRGCVSSYSCRICRFVPARCSVGNVSGTCRRLACDRG
jgi:hypothetical protein